MAARIVLVTAASAALRNTQISAPDARTFVHYDRSASPQKPCHGAVAARYSVIMAQAFSGIMIMFHNSTLSCFNLTLN